MMSAFSVLARLKFLRGSAFDVFGYTAERRTERALIGEYEATVEEILSRLSADNQEVAVAARQRPGRHSRLRPHQGRQPESRAH